MGQQLLTAVVEATRVAVMTLARDGTVLTWSPTAEEFYGYTPEYAVGRCFADLIIPPERVGEALANLQVVLEGGALDVETSHLRRDRTRADVAVSLVPLRDESGDVTEVAAVVRDTTRQKTLERQLRASAEELRTLAGEREEFLTMMAHEIRLPAAGIQLIADGLMKASGLNELERRAATDLRSQARALAEMAESVLAIARLEQGGPLDREELDIRTVARIAVDRLMDPRVIAEHADAPVMAMVDRDVLIHALVNLIANGLRYSVPPAPVVVSVGGDRDGVVVRVADHGIGIEAADLPKVFEKYGRVRTGLARRISGVGLGLYMVRLVAQAHGGTVCAESDGPGLGSTFTLRIPR